MDELREAIDRLEALKVLNHHTLDEEMWRIEEVIVLLKEVTVDLDTKIVE